MSEVTIKVKGREKRSEVTKKVSKSEQAVLSSELKGLSGCLGRLTYLKTFSGDLVADFRPCFLAQTLDEP